MKKRKTFHSLNTKLTGNKVQLITTYKMAVYSSLISKVGVYLQVDFLSKILNGRLASHDTLYKL